MLALCAFGAVSCQSKPSDKSTTAAPVAEVPAANATSQGDAAAILARKQVPILCYHQIRDWRPKDSKVAKDYIIPGASFK